MKEVSSVRFLIQAFNTLPYLAIFELLSGVEWPNPGSTAEHAVPHVERSRTYALGRSVHCKLCPIEGFRQQRLERLLNRVTNSFLKEPNFSKSVYLY